MNVPGIAILLLPLICSLCSSEVRMPEQQWNLQIAVAVSEAHAQTFSRASNKTTHNVTKLITDNITLRALIIPLPDNQQFSAAILEKACAQLEGRPVAAVLIVGASPAGFAVSLAAGVAGLPVLWARGGAGELSTNFQSVS